MGRFDDRDRELDKQHKPVSNLLTCCLFGLMLGFVAGAVWGFWYFESLGAQDAFAQTSEYLFASSPLSETVGMSDSITVVLSSGTG